MSVWKRLKNLWKWSEFEPNTDNKPLEVGTKVVQTLIKKPDSIRPQATIIKLKPKDEIEQILKENVKEDYG